MNTIIKIYIYNVHTHETIQSNQNIEKSSSGKSSFKIISMCYHTIWTLLLQPYPNSTTNSKIRKYFFLVPQFLGFIPQFSIIRTQTVINIQLCSCWKVEVSSIKIFQIFFDTHRCSQSFLLENFIKVRSLFLPSRWQASILSPEIFAPIWCRILQTVGSS